MSDTTDTLRRFATMLDGWVEDKDKEHENSEDTKRAYAFISQELNAWADDLEFVNSKKMKLNKEVCQGYLDTLKEANEQWFYGYNYEAKDYLKLVDAMGFFQHVQVEQRKKLIKEGKL